MGSRVEQGAPVIETTKDETLLLPERHPQHDLFLCDVSNVLRDFMQEMEHPFYVLGKRPVHKAVRYNYGPNWIEIQPSHLGLPTIYDKDILIFAISALISSQNENKPVSRRVRINCHELLQFANRGTAGKDYEALSAALDRLSGTRIKTNIRTGETEQTDNFGLLDTHSIVRKHGHSGRLLWCEVVLSQWVMNAIEANEVLTLDRDYFRLRKPLERRLYEIARKHCGHQPMWTIGLRKLYDKSGSASPLKHFKYMLKGVVDGNHLPEYQVQYDDEKDQVTFYNKRHLAPAVEHSDGIHIPALRDSTYEKARRAAPGYDIHALEAEWREFAQRRFAKSGERPKSVDAAFIAFCKKKSPIAA